MFKRPPLRLATSLVNVPLTLSLLFFVAACGNPSSPDLSSSSESTEQPSVTEDKNLPSQVIDGLSLPAVWQTDPLEGEIISIGIADALGSVLAVAFKDGRLQLLNFEGDRITDPADLDVGTLANGRYLLLQGTPVTLFPALTRDGELTSYIHGGSLDAPLEYPLDSGTGETLIGLCTAPPLSESDGVMRIGFWSLERPKALQSGRIVEVGDNLIVLLDEAVEADVDINACVLTATGAQIYSEPVIAAALVQQRSRVSLVTLDRSGGYARTNASGEITAFPVRDGISFKSPSAPVAMAGTGDARGGGYPNGLIVVGGETPLGNQTVTFIDASALQR